MYRYIYTGDAIPAARDVTLTPCLGLPDDGLLELDWQADKDCFRLCDSGVIRFIHSDEDGMIEIQFSLKNTRGYNYYYR